MVGFSEEILSKTAKHNRNKSELLIIDPPSAGTPPASNVQDWFSNIFKPPNDGPTAATSEPTSPKPNNEQPALTLPPRQSISRRTRFHTNSNAPQPHSINSPKRTFKIPATASTDNVSQHFLDDKPLSPPKSLIESSHRRSISSTTCSIPNDPTPRNLVESAHRRTISESTCSFEKVLRKNNVDGDEVKEEDLKSQELNRFLKEQRDKINNIFSGQIKGKAKIVLSGPSNS